MLRCGGEAGGLAGLAFYGDSLRYVWFGAGGAARWEWLPLPGGAEGDIREALAELRKRLGKSRCPVVLGVPARNVHYATLSYPRMPMAEVRNALALDFERHFPYPWSEAVWDVAEIETPSRGKADRAKMTVLAAASRRAWLERVLEAADLSGFRVCAAEPLNLAFFRALSAHAQGVCVAVELDPENLNLILGCRGEAFFFRSVPVHAEQGPLNGDSIFREVVRHVRETLVFVEKQYGGLAPGELFLGGSLGGAPGLRELLERETQLKASPAGGEPWMNLKPDGIWGLEAVAGLALRKGTQLDLRTPEYAERHRCRRSFSLSRFAAVWLLFAFFAAHGGYIAAACVRLRALTTLVEATRWKVEELRRDSGLLTAELTRLAGEEARQAQVLDFLEEEMPTLEALRAIENGMEDGTRLDSIRFAPLSVQEGGPRVRVASLEGSSADEEGVIALSASLARSGVFSGVSVPGSRKDRASGRVAFEMLLTLNPLGQRIFGLEMENADGGARGE